MIDVKQSWWHFEDMLSPSQGKLIRQVIDLYTDEQVIPFNISSSFIELKVKSRFKGNELEFIQENDFYQDKNIILINLGNLDDWSPVVGETNLKHVRIEIQYIDISPVFEKIHFLKLFKTGYSSSCTINNYIQPEFYITIPLGMKLKSKNNNFLKILLEEILDNKFRYTKLYLEKRIFQRYFNKKLKYNFLIEEKSYNSIVSSINNPETELNGIFIDYDIIYQNKYWLVSLFPILLIVLGLVNVFISPVENLSNFNLSGIIIFISFLTFFYSLIREGYELPVNKKFILLTILISGFLILFPQFIKSILIQF